MAGTLADPTAQGTAMLELSCRDLVSTIPYRDVPSTATFTAWDSSTSTQHQMWLWALMELRGPQTNAGTRIFHGRFSLSFKHLPFSGIM